MMLLGGAVIALGFALPVLADAPKQLADVIQFGLLAYLLAAFLSAFAANWLAARTPRY